MVLLSVFRMARSAAKGAVKPAIGPLDPCVSHIYTGLRLCDVFGHVNNARYLELFELARWEQHVRAGYHTRFWRGKLLAVVGSYHVQYVSPLLPFQTVEVHTQTVGVHAKGLVLEHRIITRPKERPVRKAIARFLGLGGKKKKAMSKSGTAEDGKKKEEKDGFSLDRLRGSSKQGKGKLIAVGVMKAVIIHKGHAVDGATALEKLGFLGDMPEHVLSNMYFMEEAPEVTIDISDIDTATSVDGVPQHGADTHIVGKAPYSPSVRSTVSTGDPRTVVGPVGLSEAHSKAVALAAKHGVSLKPAPSEHLLMNRFDDQWRLRVLKERDVLRDTGVVATAPLLGMSLDRKKWKTDPAPVYDFSVVPTSAKSKAAAATAVPASAKTTARVETIPVEGFEEAMEAHGDARTPAATICAARNHPPKKSEGETVAAATVNVGESYAETNRRGE